MKKVSVYTPIIGKIADLYRRVCHYVDPLYVIRLSQRRVASIHRKLHLAHSIQRDVAHAGAQLERVRCNSFPSCGFHGWEDRNGSTRDSRLLWAELASAPISHWPFSWPPICIRELLVTVSIRHLFSSTFPVDHIKVTSQFMTTTLYHRSLPFSYYPTCHHVYSMVSLTKVSFFC